MHLGIHTYRWLTKALHLCLFVTIITACVTYPASPEKLPEVFTSPAVAPDFSLSTRPSVIERRLTTSDCETIDSNVSGLAMTGLITRPDKHGGVYLDIGSTPDGTKWFLHRSADNRDITYCGIALVGSASETKVSIAGVHSKDMQEIKIAVESGDFFCKCRQLSR